MTRSLARIRSIALAVAVALGIGALAAGVATPTAASAVSPPISVDDTATGTPGFTYSSGWTGDGGLPTDSYFDGTEHWTNGGNVSATFAFEGTRATIVGAKDPGHGYAFASVDGGAETRLDLYNPTRQLQQTLFDTGALASGSHTVRFRMDGTKNPSSTKAGAQIDFATYTPADPTQPTNPAPQIIPALTSWTGGSGTLTLPASVRVVVSQADADTALQGRTVRDEATVLVADLAEENVSASLAVGATPAAGDVVLSTAPGLPAEGYRLEIGDRVTIAATTSAGIFYGGRTLLQLLSLSHALPVGQTTDAPGQGMRGGMIDAGRKYWDVSYIKDLIREMSYQKLNMLNLHLSEAEGFRLYSPKFPGLADPQNSYDHDQIADIVAFAKAHHVQVIPGFEFPGHATAISNYFGIGFGDGQNPCTAADMYSHLTPNWVIDMTSQKARDDAADVLREFLPWFDSSYVHLGGDELPPQLADCARVQQFIAADPNTGSAGDMLVGFVNQLNDVVVADGKRSIIYNGFEHMPLSQQSLDANIVIQDWEGDGTNAAFNGHDKIWMNSSYAYLTPNNYHNLSPNLDYLTQTWAPGTGSDLLGSSFGVWADYNMWAEDQFFEQKMVPLRAAIADRTWNVTARSTTADLTARLAATGHAPGVTGAPERERVGADQPLHKYAFTPAPYPSGYTWAGSPGQTLFVKDETGRLNGSTYIINNPTFTDDGVRGSALSFSNDRQGVGLGGTDLPGPWTMSVWVKQSSALANATLLSSREGTSILLRDGATGKVAMQTPQGRVTFNATLPVGEWVSVGLVNDGTATSLYLNGEKVDSVQTAMALPLAAIGGWNISLRGTIDELTINDAALTDAQIADRYTAEKPAPVVTGLVDHWSFDETSGVAKDLIGGADATFVGASRTPGRFGSAARLEGASDGLQVGASDLTGPWTASLWVKRTGAETAATLFSGGSTALRLEQWPDTSKIGFTRFGVADDTIDYTAPLNEWTYLTFTSDGSVLNAYANGHSVGQIPVSGPLGRDWIGRVASGNALDAAHADIDDVLVYNRALTAGEVSALYAGFGQHSGNPVQLGVALSFTTPPASPLAAGDVVAITATTTNSGLVDLTGPTVTPRFTSAGTCTLPATLAAGQQATCAVSYTVTSADVAAGSIALVADAAAVATNPLHTAVSGQSNTLKASTASAALRFDASASVRCVAGKGQVAVTAKNNDTTVVSFGLDSDYGSKTVTSVAPTTSAFHAFTTRLATVPAGHVTVTATGTIDGRQLTTRTVVDYAAKSCG